MEFEPIHKRKVYIITSAIVKSSPGKVAKKWDRKSATTNPPPHTVATLRDCPREDWLATHEDWLATGISTSFWRLQNTEHVRSSVPTSCRLQVAQSLHSVRLAHLRKALSEYMPWPPPLRKALSEYMPWPPPLRKALSEYMPWPPPLRKALSEYMPWPPPLHKALSEYMPWPPPLRKALSEYMPWPPPLRKALSEYMPWPPAMYRPVWVHALAPRYVRPCLSTGPDRPST